eukprot:Skav219234  [mRNA]  locus=scaffold2950:40419:41956:+ [translate_table: standard]
MDENGTLERLQEIVRAVKARENTSSTVISPCLGAEHGVSMDFMANGLLALGAHPAMVHSVEELDVAARRNRGGDPGVCSW